MGSYIVQIGSHRGLWEQKLQQFACFLIDFLCVDNFINDSLFFTFQVSEAIRIFDESAIDHEMCYSYDISVCQQCGNSP